MVTSSDKEPETEVVVDLSKYLNDWFIIRRDCPANGRLVPTDYGAKYVTEDRFGEADVEGYLHELRAILHSLRNKRDFGAKRCAIEFVDDDTVLLWSPRNSSVADPCDVNSLIKAIEEAL